MKAYIHAGALIERFSELMREAIADGNTAFADGVEECRMIAYTMEREDVKRIECARWERIGECHQRCTGCGDDFSLSEDAHPFVYHMFHCPNCGANMVRRRGQ